jgi:hypothetical protein
MNVEAARRITLLLSPALAIDLASNGRHDRSRTVPDIGPLPTLPFSV